MTTTPSTLPLSIFHVLTLKESSSSVSISSRATSQTFCGELWRSVKSLESPPRLPTSRSMGSPGLRIFCLIEPPSWNTIQLYFSFDLVKSDLANILRWVVPLREELGEPAQAAHQQVHGLARGQDLLPDRTSLLILLYRTIGTGTVPIYRYWPFLKDAPVYHGMMEYAVKIPWSRKLCNSSVVQIALIPSINESAELTPGAL